MRYSFLKGENFNILSQVNGYFLNPNRTIVFTNATVSEFVVLL